MISELRKLKIIIKSKDLGLPVSVVTKSENASCVLQVSDDYPKKNYSEDANAEKFVSRLVGEDLFEWAKPVDENSFSFLGSLGKDVDLKAFEVDMVNSFRLIATNRYSKGTEQLVVSTEKYGDARTNGNFKNKITEMFLSGEDKEVIDATAYVFATSSNVNPKEYKNIQWIADLLFNAKIDGKTSIDKLDSFDETERSIIDLVVCNDGLTNLNNTKFDDPKRTLDLLTANVAIRKKLEEDDSHVLEVWIETGNYSELETFFKNFQETDIPHGRIEYTNVIMGNKFSGLALDPDLMRYLLNNKKMKFVHKLQKLQKTEGYEYISACMNRSIIGEKETWEILNLNEMTEQDIIEYDSLYMDVHKISALRERENLIFEHVKHRVTPKVLKALLNYNKVSNLMVVLYGLLDFDDPEKTLSYVREIPFDLPYISGSEDQTRNTESVAQQLRIQKFSAYCQKLSYIKNISKRDVYKILANYEKLLPLLNDMKNIDDLNFALQTLDTIEGDTLAERKEKYLSEEENQKTAEEIGVTVDEARAFILSGNMEIVRAYCASSVDEQKRINIRKIAKAEILGKLDVLKYADFEKELGCNISNGEKGTWIRNISLSKNGYVAKEHDDFKATMVIGQTPVETCQNYKSGCYNETLLAGFDANKKVLYVNTQDGEVVGRALLRLTKVADKEGTSQSLQFMDVTENSSVAAANSKSEETLVVFLEKPYIKNGISEKQAKEIRTMLRELAAKKAHEMGIELLANRFYEGGETVTKYMYISKSKNGAQYLDSLGGKAALQDESKYIRSTFEKF